MKDEKSRNISIFEHIHSRLVLKGAGRPLRDFKNAKELFGAGLNVVQGVWSL